MCALLLLALPLACGQPEPGPVVGPAPAPTVARQVYGADGSLLVDVERPARPPNLIVVVIDALRHDALGNDALAAPEGRARMPYLASLARRGVRFENATAPSPWTLPSVMSLLTGMLPSEHGQVHPDTSPPFPIAITTYPEILQQGYGYETAALLNGVWFQQRRSSLLQGFGYARTVFALQGLMDDVGAWNRQRNHGRPFFLLLHTYEAHDPYGEKNHWWPPVRHGTPHVDERLLAHDADPAEIFRQCFLDADACMGLQARMGMRLRDTLQRYKYRGYREAPRPALAAELRDAYWDGVRWVDGLLKESVSQLETMGLLKNTLLVITSDHGEAFGEHGNLAHGLSLHDELLRVPLVMVGPEPFNGGRVVEEGFGLIDLLPTCLDWAGLTPLTGADGRSGAGLLDGETWCRPVVSEEVLSRANTGEHTRALRISARTPKWKYIVTLDLETAEVREEGYDLTVDPWEEDDVGEGTGRLPEHVLLDACMCPAVEAVRSRIWPEPAEENRDVGEVYTTPYGAAAQPEPSDRPSPCQSTP